MINWVLRGAVLLWALLFFIVGIRGVLNPASFTETFGIIADGVAANTVRADMSAFFLVAAGGAAIGGCCAAGRARCWFLLRFTALRWSAA